VKLAPRAMSRKLNASPISGPGNSAVCNANADRLISCVQSATLCRIRKFREILFCRTFLLRVEHGLPCDFDHCAVGAKSDQWESRHVVSVFTQWTYFGVIRTFFGTLR
jgi:hypothetical protein